MQIKLAEEIEALCVARWLGGVIGKETLKGVGEGNEVVALKAGIADAQASGIDAEAAQTEGQPSFVDRFAFVGIEPWTIRHVTEPLYQFFRRDERNVGFLEDLLDVEQ